LKVVPRPEEVTVETETKTLKRGDVRSQINPPDMNALELALELRDQHGGKVSLLSMGPPLFEPYLRLAIAVGADHAYLLSDRALGGADTLATSYTLAKGIEKIGEYDLILCGEESSDGATAQVPPGIGEWLDIPQITYATSLDLMDGQGKVKARRELAGGHEVIAVPLPAVASVTVGMNEPRFIDFDRKPLSEEPPRLTIWTAEDLGVDPEMIGWDGSPTAVDELYEAPGRERKREFISGTPEEKAKALFERIAKDLELKS
jgi:electron transfer flavoprotein beta subunit